MESRLFSCALISSDPEFRKSIEAEFGPELGLDLIYVIEVPFSKIQPADLENLTAAEPNLVIVDLEENPALGLKLAQMLADSDSSWKVIAAGFDPTPELALAAMRAGVNEYLMKPVARNALVSALERLGRKLSKREPGSAAKKVGRLITVTGVKGGCGSTTVAVNLAVSISQSTEAKTLLLDMDPELGEVSVFLGAEGRFDFVDLVRNLHRIDGDLLGSFVSEHSSGIHFIPAPETPDKSQSVTADHIRHALQLFRRHYDYVIVDVANSSNPLAVAAIQESNSVVVVSETDVLSLRNLKILLARLRRSDTGDDHIHLVLNRFRPSVSLSPSDVKDVVGLEPVLTLQEESSVAVRAVDDGNPVVLLGKGRLAQDLRSLGSRLTGVSGEPARETGWLRLPLSFGRGKR